MAFGDTPFPVRGGDPKRPLKRTLLYFMECFTVFGLFFWPGAAFLTVVALLLVSSPARTIAVLLVSLAVCELVFALVFRPRCRIKRVMPPRVCAGKEFTITYRIANRSFLPAFEIEADPLAGCNGLEFRKRAIAAYLPARGEAEAQSILYAARRGVYRIGRATAASDFPFGMLRTFSRDGERSTLRVYPDYTQLESVGLPVGKRFQSSGLARMARVSEADDFRSCRDFRGGDNPRHIHWRSSGRSGKLIIKEFQEEYLNRAAMLLDTKLPGNRHATAALEAALSLAAAVAESLMRDDCVVDIFAAGNEVRYLQTGRHISSFEAVLDLLAEVEGSSFFELGELKNGVLERIGGIGGALVILLDADAERIELVNALRRSGCEMKVVVVGIEPPEGLPEHWSFISCAAIKSGKVKQL